jgi:hypothetical protein
MALVQQLLKRIDRLRDTVGPGVRLAVVDEVANADGLLKCPRGRRDGHLRS